MSNQKKKAIDTKSITVAVSVIVLVLAVAGSLAAAAKMNTKGANAGGTESVFPAVSNIVSDSDMPEAIPDEQPQRLTIASQAQISVMGDMMGHMPTVTAAYNSAAKSYNFDNIFTYIQTYVSASDYAIANLETTLRGTGNGIKYQGYPNFNTPDAFVDSLQKAGFDMLLTANNHSYDTGPAGMKRTLEVLDKRKIEHTGTFLSENDKRYLVTDVNGIKIGMICYTYETSGANKNRKYLNGAVMNDDAAKLINSFDYDKLDNFYAELGDHIAAMKKEGAEEIMLFIHWGIEYKTSPNSYQKKIAQKACDLGVDVIVGGHPHVIQPAALFTSSVDSSHKTLCLYSTGNAVSNQRAAYATIKTGHTEDGCLFSVTFTKYSNGRVVLSDTNLLPTWVNLFVDPNTQKKVYRIVPLDKSVKDWGEAFDMKGSVLKDAKKSYERTAEITDAGMKQAQNYYRSAAAAILSDSDIAA